MTNDEFNNMVTAFRIAQDELILKKGHDYTIASADRLFNFKFVGDLLGLKPEQVCAVYWLKHVIAILTYLKTGRIESEEPLDGRFLDEANYLLLLKACLNESEYNERGASATSTVTHSHEAGCLCGDCIINRAIVQTPGSVSSRGAAGASALRHR
jgi:hypothetical protein